MGTVYEAVQENLGRRVAVKLLDERLSYDREQLERFRREAEVVAALGHPNIVQVTDFQYPDQLGKQPFLVMELLRGESLAGRIEHEGAMAFERVAFIVAQVLSALGAAHRAGVVHRDVKPDNIFLLADAAIPDTVKVLDFGIAKLSDGASIGPAQQKLTSTNAMLGTPAFMAPEQARGADDVDARADVYAVGATMYQALTGKMPFEAASVPALLFAIVEKTPAPLRELRPDVPADFIAVVERAMAKRREDRFQDTNAMRAALAQWSGLPASNPTPVVSPRSVIESAATVAGNLAHAPTVASNPPPPAIATPMVVHHTPAAPTPVVPYAPRSMPDHVAAKRRNRTILILAGLATFLVYQGLNTFRSVRESRGHARADDSAAVELGQSVARNATSIGLNAAAQALGVAPPASIAVVAAPSTAPTATASTTPTPLASAVAQTTKRKRYGGKQGWKSGGNFSECKGCNWEAFGNDMGLRTHDVTACYAASEYEPPMHETPWFTVKVDESGHMSLVSVVGGAPNLDRCLYKIVESVGIKGGSGTAQFGFQGECTQGWAGHCD
jgi:serine/threonine-protein kinase